ncbi:MULTISPECIES: hypothetical protein [unclassified Streptomyces]|uniref:hypothetical protein n=1 Tax=unclassified Streptomyces TaxID=2593676 RepID=UPI0033C18203
MAARHAKRGRPVQTGSGFWQLEFYLDRQDPAFGEMFLVDEALLHWWSDRADEIQAAFVAASRWQQWG